MKYYEEIEIGEVHVIGQHTFSADDIKKFALRFDPQLFHTDEEAAAHTHFRKLCASGWHTVVTWMRLAVDFRRRDDEARRARGEPSAKMGPSPGFRELKWIRPVFAGDTIEYATEVVAKRVSNSRPQWGLLTMKNTGTNQRGEPVLSFIGNAFIERRSAPAAAS